MPYEKLPDSNMLSDTTGNELKFSAQGMLTFTLLNTNLLAAFKKIGDENVFLVMPRDKSPSGGMSVKKMVDDINDMIKKYSGSDGDLKSSDITQSLQDIQNASKKKAQPEVKDEPENEPGIVDNEITDDIYVELRQAFLLLRSNCPVEYAFEIDVRIAGLFPENATFFKIEKLSLAVWNTSRKSILDRMNVVDIESILSDEV